MTRLLIIAALCLHPVLAAFGAVCDCRGRGADADARCCCGESCEHADPGAADACACGLGGDGGCDCTCCAEAEPLTPLATSDARRAAKWSVNSDGCGPAVLARPFCMPSLVTGHALARVSVFQPPGIIERSRLCVWTI